MYRMGNCTTRRYLYSVQRVQIYLDLPHENSLIHAIRKNDTMCPICLEPIRIIFMFIPCFHPVCEPCAIQMYNLKKRLTCPLCRNMYL